MRKQRWTALAAGLAIMALAGSFASAEAGEGAGKKLVVGTMANALGLPLHQAQKAGYFKNAGLNVEVVIFATGAPINEAMAADELDLAVSGMATVYALATGRYIYIGDGCITLEGEAIYARPDSPIVKAKSKIDGLLGDAKTLKNVAILAPTATTAHYQSIKYVEAAGLTADDFRLVSMEYPQAYQAFASGQGDLIATRPPYSSRLKEAGNVKVCDLRLVTGSPLVDTVYVQKKVMANRRPEILAFLDCYYRACTDLRNDNALRKAVGLEWYKEEGIKYSEEAMNTEVRQQTYHTLDTLLTADFPFGYSMTSIGQFFVGQGMIDKANYPNIAASLDKSLIEELKAKKK